MAQTTGAMSSRAAVLELSTNGSVWTDHSGLATNVEDTTQTRISGEAYTFDGDTAIIKAGKREPAEIKVSVVYTEGAAEATEVVRAAFEGATDLYLRWAPKGATTGNFRYTTSAGIVIEYNYPPIEAESGDPILTEFTLRAASVTKAVIP